MGFRLAALRPEVKLEIGPFASWVPSGESNIQSFAAEEFPAVFDRPKCSVVAITFERTFCERATSLHELAHRTTKIPPGYSRYNYVLYQLARSPVCQNALTDIKLLEDVVWFRQRFYRSNRARYDLAVPGSIRLLPTEAGDHSSWEDYQLLQPMSFKTPWSWEKITGRLQKLEDRIN